MALEFTITDCFLKFPTGDRDVPPINISFWFHFNSMLLQQLSFCDSRIYQDWKWAKVFHNNAKVNLSRLKNWKFNYILKQAAISSLLSPQSSNPSHICEYEIQSLLAHVNWLSRHWVKSARTPGNINCYS